MKKQDNTEQKLEMKISLTNNLSQQLEQFDSKQKQLVLDMYNHYVEHFKQIKAEYEPEALSYNIHRFVDAILDEELRDNTVKISCRKGCFYCCEQNVDITEEEALLLVKIAKERGLELNKRLLKKQFKYSVDNWHKQEHKQCVFLSKGECQVYEHRPTACRKHIVFTDPKLCDTTVIHDKVGKIVNTHVEVIATAAINVSESDSMPKMLLKILK